MATVAGKFPNNNFAIIDFSAAGLKGKPQNVEGLLFKEQEAGYLAGYLAGLWAKDNNATTVSTVGGQKIPPVDHYIAGFQKGAKDAEPEHQDAERLLAGLRRPGEVQGDRPRPDRPGLEGRLPGGRPVRPRRARRGQGEGRPGHRRRRRPGLPRRPHPHLGPQEGRRGGVRRHQARPGRASSRAAPTSSPPSRTAASASARSAPRARSTPTRSSRSRTRSPPARSRTSPTRSSSQECSQKHPLSNYAE